MPRGVYVRTPEMCARMSRKSRAWARTPEGRAQTEYRVLKAHTSKARAKMARTLRAQARTPEGRAQTEYRILKAHTPKAISKMVRTMRAQARTPEGRARLERMLVKSHTPKAREKQSRTLRAWARTPEGRARLERMLVKAHTPKARAKMARTMRAQARTPEGRARLERMHAASRKGLKPTRPERVVRTKLPSRFAYGGDNSFGIKTNRHIRHPDFYDPKTREAVEVFGDYWHDPARSPHPERCDTPEQRVAEYAAVGWSCRVVWERDVRGFVL
jgi:hypothetical protein